jgi:acyl-coenzyme A synthetase/AMP-(fatty) acid ligase
LACGYLYPDAAVEVVGESDESLPYGVEGLLRFKRPHMVNEYYNDPLLSAKYFRDGWFYSGDRGRLMNDGLLILTGRDSELINRGGIKIDPVSIDHYLVDYPGVEDAAAFGFINKIGVQDVAVAIVIADNFDIDTLKIKLHEKLGGARYPSYFIKVNKIPRNQMGKVMRGQLSKQFDQLVKSNMFLD